MSSSKLPKFSVVLMFIFVAMMPIISASVVSTTSIENEPQESESKATPILLEVGKNVPIKDLPFHFSGTTTSGRAVCPALQNDGGSPGDAGNTSNTSKSIGSDPTQSTTGCVDANDGADYYKFTMSSGWNVDVELTVPTGADFDLYLADGNGTTAYAGSEYNDPLERVSTAGSQVDGIAGTYIIAVFQYTGDGSYTLETWANETLDCDDLWPNGQDDGGIGSDAPNSHADSPPNMGSNVSASYTGCLDKASDENDVFSFDVPADHVIEAKLTIEDSNNDFDLFIEDANGTELDSSEGITTTEFATTLGTPEEGTAGTYLINVSAYGGKGNYTLEVWTNYSLPMPNLEFDAITSPEQVASGSTIEIEVDVNNTGRIDANDTFTMTAYLSVDGIQTDRDHYIGNTTMTTVLVGEAKTGTITGTVPSNLVGGTYYVFVVLDSEEVLDESNEDDNTARDGSQVMIDSEMTVCPSQNDAGSGADAMNTSSTAYDLGNPVDTEYRGCIDENDVSDAYTVTIPAGDDLELAIVDAPDAYFAVDVVDEGTGEEFSSSFFGDHEISTVDSPLEGQGGTFTVYVNRSGWFGGAGTYRMIFGTPEPYIPPPPVFSCSGQGDILNSGDASNTSSSALDLGLNPVVEGQGCMSAQDDRDVFTFSLDQMQNVVINFEADEGTGFTSELSDSQGNMIMSWNGSTWSTLENINYEGNAGPFYLSVISNDGIGFYNISVSTLPAAPADLSIASLTCGDNMSSDEQLFYSFEVINQRGPAMGEFSWSLDLVNSNGVTTETINSGVLSTPATYGESVAVMNSQNEISEDTPTGEYSCVLSVNIDQTVMEQDMDNNQVSTDTFNIQNAEEIWANDVDRDGFNTTDTGDGIVDDCPTSYGTSTEDRFGCSDFDGDGWSNANDFLPEDATQSQDTDEDGFGDNPEGTDGDQCPEVAGVLFGMDGRGCPADSDSDGVFDNEDQCPGTAEGITVDETGCELDSDGDGVLDSQDNCPDTAENVTVDDTGCVIDDSPIDEGGEEGNEQTGDGGEETNTGSDGTESGLSNQVMLFGGIGALVLFLLLGGVLMRRGGSDSITKQDAFVNAAFDSGFGQVNQFEQYVQQLVAQGYDENTARAYAQQNAAQLGISAPAGNPMYQQYYNQYYQQFVNQGYDPATAQQYAAQYAQQATQQ